MKKIQQISTVIVLLIAVFTLFYALKDNKENPEDIVLKDLKTSNQVSIKFSEKPTVLLFFTSWCPYCNEDAPKIVQLYNKYKNDLNIFGINITNRDDIQDVKDYVANYHIDYPILLDESGSIYKKYAGSGFPSLYFFNSNGEVIDTIIGATDLDTIENSFIFLKNNYKA
ncbi:TlpA family protein disulfide reductase [Cohnella endophytica]|uniref:TlpA family protein disulfide reductase n=1 Tax=Cohnella endophytica TaxID=2419778 RepID=A0A494Y5L5_9BACL|nr:TlpA disulfide reductase family protein [Cohnella endophytica]RKP57979.1 TlpA family protein disulfide reductase [Cohnella endophytica]